MANNANNVNNANNTNNANNANIGILLHSKLLTKSGVETELCNNSTYSKIFSKNTKFSNGGILLGENQGY